MVERAVYRTDDAVIREIVFNPFEKFQMNGDLPHVPKPPADSTSPVMDGLLKMPLQEAVMELKRLMLNRALKMARHNQKEAAEKMGLTYHQFRGLYRSMKDRME